jgi:two-component system, sensor histidine kinase YesM
LAVHINRSLKWKLISLIVTILIFTIATIVFFNYTQTVRSVKRDIDQLSNQILKQANMNLNRYYAEYETIFLLLGSSIEFRDWLQLSKGTTSSDSVRYYERIKANYLNRLFLQYPEVMSVTLYNPSGLEQHFTSTYNLAYPYTIQDETYISSSRGSFDKVQLITGISENYVDSSNKRIRIPTLTLVKQFNNGYLKMDISLKPSQNVMDQINIVNSGIAAVINENGTIIHHSESELVMTPMNERIVQLVSGKQEGSINNEAQNELIIFQTIEMTNWKIIAVLPYEKIAESISFVRNLAFIIGLSALIISVFLTYLAAASITRRISELRRIMIMTQVKNDYTIRANIDGSDEVTDLSDTFNKLLNHLEQSVHDLAETRALQSKAVISALQSQINSHFLYNTLETMNSMAIIARQAHIGEVAVALSNMLRYTSDYKDWEVTLQRESDHLRDYLRIMKTRFGEELSYDIRIPPELLSAACTKALLQPLVENSIKHTRETSGDSVHIDISVEQLQGQQLKVAVCDNGQGFTETTLARLRGEQAGFQRHQYTYTGVGLSNLIYRLYMFYSSEADIRFYNHPNHGGAVVEVILPLKYKTDNMEGAARIHVSDLNR